MSDRVMLSAGYQNAYHTARTLYHNLAASGCLRSRSLQLGLGVSLI
ncbi:MAG: hypothetical protein QGM49_09105 [Actinomycetota bacterium]|nr:hypothetical protein [Actinomycetota bacterium]